MRPSLVLASLLAFATPALAQQPSGWQWSAGPTIPFALYDFRSPTPISILAGGGLQISVTHSSFQRELGGRTWDMLDGALLLFGTRVNPAGGPEFGQLSGAVGVCTLSSVLCLVGGLHALDSTGALKPAPFAGFNLSLNIAFGPPPAPARAQTLLPTRAAIPRGNTLYLGIVPITDDIQNAP